MHTHTYMVNPRKNVGRLKKHLHVEFFQLVHLAAAQLKAINLIGSQITFLLFSLSKKRRGAAESLSKYSPAACQKCANSDAARPRYPGRGRRKEPSLGNY